MALIVGEQGANDYDFGRANLVNGFPLQPIVPKWMFSV